MGVDIAARRHGLQTRWPLTPKAGWPLHDSRKAAGESGFCGLGSAPARMAGQRRPPTALLKKGPVIGDGSQSREETLGRVSRFAAALCVVTHTRRGDFFEMRLGGPMSAGDGGLSSAASARLAGGFSIMAGTIGASAGTAQRTET
jgi:hypothetical protein